MIQDSNVDVSPDLDSNAEEQIRCPVCRARQELSDECRRCKCDLSLVNRVIEAARQARRLSQRFLHHHDYEAALLWARRFHALLKNEQSQQWLDHCRVQCQKKS